MEIGRKLRELREGKDLSQGDIEERTGLLRCYLSRVENGHTVPAIETLEKLASALYVPFWRYSITATPRPLRSDCVGVKRQEGHRGKTRRLNQNYRNAW
jgi:transcriptional regulator with XRE-family HTH domain